MTTAESVLDVPVNSASQEKEETCTTAAETALAGAKKSAPWSVAAYEVQKKQLERRAARAIAKSARRVSCVTCGGAHGTLLKARDQDGILLAVNGEQAYRHKGCALDGFAIV